MLKRTMESGIATSSESSLVLKALEGTLVFCPVPPGAERGDLELPLVDVELDATDEELQAVKDALKNGTLTPDEADHAEQVAGLSAAVADGLPTAIGPSPEGDWNRELETAHELDRLSLLAVRLVDRMQHRLLDQEPLAEVHFRLTERARAVLAIGWNAMVKRGIFPLPPVGRKRFERLRQQPCGAMHFVSASDLDAGYYYTMGAALSPEAQALRTMDVSFGLDGELIVPGQAVSPIPPFRALATRLFAASIPTSSNISEEVQSIPLRNYPHPKAEDDLEPRRGGIYRPPAQPKNGDELILDLRRQFAENSKRQQESPQDRDERFKTRGADNANLPPIKAVFDVTGMTPLKIRHWMGEALKQADLAEQRLGLALYLNIETDRSADRVSRINQVVDSAAELGLKYVAVADDEEDQWLPNLLEYLEPYELNAVADYSDAKGIVVVDGRPVDPVYTAATAAQRIQSVFSTLAVDILKMGLWLCLDAMTSRAVWQEIVANPHIPQRMLLMPIGIVEPWDAFVDNRDPERTPRAILDPFEKIKFMIDEAEVLGMPSLLTDTRHKGTWVLLGRKTAADQKHPRERFFLDPATGKPLGRTPQSAIPLLSWEEFMQCERRARRAGVLLGQAGSVETEQLFRIISETTYDAAKEGANPVTAVWTAETERVLTTGGPAEDTDLQGKRASDVSPFLAVVNRGFESHAKLDGWLRYLAGCGHADETLRGGLQNRRSELLQLLDALVAAQARRKTSPAAQQEYQAAWEIFRAKYLEYHREIKDNFVRVRDLVARQWAARK